jgi:hypothetical protein
MKKIGLVCFGEVNTPYERLVIKHDHALKTLQEGVTGKVCDAGIVIDDPAYETADAAIEKLRAADADCLIVCVIGWVPTHAVIRVTDKFRHLPMLLWGLCGWRERGKLITTADQAGTTAIRPAFEAMHYRFKYIYSIIDKPEPIDKIEAFTNAAYAARSLRDARVGTMGYRDMLLYGTQYEGNSMRGKFGVEVEPFEMLEMVQNIEQLDPEEVKKGVSFVQDNWKFEKPCDDEVVEKGVKYALAIGRKIKERGYKAITLIDVDGMKKLLGIMVSSIVKTPNTAMTVMPFVLIIQLVMSGMIFELKGLTEQIAKLTISKWSLNAIGITANLNAMENFEPAFLSDYAYTISNMVQMWLILILFTLIYGVISIISLRFVDRDKR